MSSRAVTTVRWEDGALPTIPPFSSVVLAFESDERAYEVVKHIRTLEDVRFFSAGSNYPPARYFNRNEIARRALAALNEQHPDKFDVADFENIMQVIEVTAHVPGDYVEIGVYKGTSALAALRYMKARGMHRRSWFLDTFEGFAYEAARVSRDAVWADTHNDVLLQEVEAKLTAESSDARVVQTNIVLESLPIEINSIAVANVDVDIYEAVKAALEKVAPLIRVGGVIICEDSGHTPYLIGAYAAVREFIEADTAHHFTPLYQASGQTLLVRVAA
jgi:predicted O-methyltransferase YrrM